MRDNKFADEMQAQHNASLATGGFLQRRTLTVDQMPTSNHLTRDQANGAKYAAALRAIIERADTDKPGTSKVQDMRYIAVKALEGG